MASSPKFEKEKLGPESLSEFLSRHVLLHLTHAPTSVMINHEALSRGGTDGPHLPPVSKL